VDVRAMNIRLSCVIVAYNSDQILPTICHSLSQQGFDSISVWIVDNSGSDRTRELIKHLACQFSDELKLVYRALPHNPGYAAAVNHALSEMDPSQFVLIVNPDVIIPPGAVGTLVQTALDHTDVGVVAPCLLGDSGRAVLTDTRFPSLLSIVFASLHLHKTVLWRLMRRYKRGSAAMSYVDWVSGACMLVAPAARKDVTGIDESYFMYMEDVDFCRQLSVAGWRTVIVAASLAVHSGGVSSRDAYARAFVQSRLAKLIYFQKWGGPGSYITLVCWFIIESLMKILLGRVLGRKEREGPSRFLSIVRHELQKRGPIAAQFDPSLVGPL
jgi:N-acetylglucosaminyl-diphospho-decaprenol L-rhamnosyltransferase